MEEAFLFLRSLPVAPQTVWRSADLKLAPIRVPIHRTYHYGLSPKTAAIAEAEQRRAAE